MSRTTESAVHTIIFLELERVIIKEGIPLPATKRKAFLLTNPRLHKKNLYWHGMRQNGFDPKDQSLWQVSESTGKAWLFVRNRIHRIGLSRATDCWCTFCYISGVARNYSNDSACCPREMKEICMYSYAINIPEGERMEKKAVLDWITFQVVKSLWKWAIY